MKKLCITAIILLLMTLFKIRKGQSVKIPTPASERSIIKILFADGGVIVRGTRDHK